MKNTDVFYNWNFRAVPNWKLNLRLNAKRVSSFVICGLVAAILGLILPGEWVHGQSLVNPYLPEPDYQIRIAKKRDLIPFSGLPPLVELTELPELEPSDPNQDKTPGARQEIIQLNKRVEVIKNPFLPPKPAFGPLVDKIPDHLRDRLSGRQPNFLQHRRERKKYSGLIAPIQNRLLYKIDPSLQATEKNQTQDDEDQDNSGEQAPGNDLFPATSMETEDLPIENPYMSPYVDPRNAVEVHQSGDPTASYRSLSEQRLFNQEYVFSLSLEEAMHLAIANSPELRGLQADVIINNQEMVRQDANFDFSHFVETLYDSQVNPVGNNLDGAQNTLRNKLWNLETGVRQRNRNGGDLSLSQQFGHLNSNSIFINPNNQATGQLALELNQPLARGAARDINESGIELARIATLNSQAALRTEIQNQLLSIVSTYWNLVLERGKVVQLNRSVERGVTILQLMADRQNIDVLPQQMIRAKAAVARRQSLAAQAAFDALRAQETLMRRLFGEQYQAKATFEIVPITIQPGQVAISDLQTGLEFGIQNRPEVHNAMQEIQTAGVQKRIAENELFPQLDLVFAAFGKGLRDRSNFGRAWSDQFSANEPSFQIGLNYEIPIGNRAARANASQKELEISKLQSQLQTVLNDVTLEIRDQDIVRKQYNQTTGIQLQALELANQELQMIETRRKLLLDGDQIALLYLDDLIQAQERVQQAETAYLQNITSFGISQAAWLKAIGALDQYNVPVN